MDKSVITTLIGQLVDSQSKGLLEYTIESDPESSENIVHKIQLINKPRKIFDDLYAYLIEEYGTKGIEFRCMTEANTLAFRTKKFNEVQEESL